MSLFLLLTASVIPGNYDESLVAAPVNSPQSGQPPRDKQRTTSAADAKNKKTNATASGVRLTFDSGGKESRLILNVAFDEDNTSPVGSSVEDYYPDYAAGDRINPADPDIQKATLRLLGRGKSEWKLVFPQYIKIWRRVRTSYQQVLTGLSYETVLPQKISLLIEGIEPSPKEGVFPVTAILTPVNSLKSETDAVFLHVRRNGGVMEEAGGGPGGRSARGPAQKVNPWINWPDCVSTKWAEAEGRRLRETPRRPPSPGGNGLPVVTVTTPDLGAVARDLQTISGTATPALPNTIVKQVSFRLYRTNATERDAEYWNGSQWIKKTSEQPLKAAVFKDGRWSYQLNLSADKTLRSGNYSLEVRAYDNFNRWGYTRSFFVIDNNPTLTVTNPGAQQTLSRFDTITGVATPAEKTRSVAKVQLRLARAIETETGIRAEFWDGKTWVPQPCAPLTAGLEKIAGTAEVNWSLKLAFPPRVPLDEGRYHVTVVAYDDAGDGVSVANDFIVWRTPQLTIDATGLGKPLTALPPIRGTVKLIPGGTPVTDVKVQLIQRKGGGIYWDGSAWKVPPTKIMQESDLPSIPAVYSVPVGQDGTSEWKLETNLPGDAELPEGYYLFAATAYNNAEIVAQESAGFHIYRGPVITVTWPALRSQVASLGEAPFVSGTASPGVKGIPIAEVRLTLSRWKEGGGAEIWDGTVWKPVPINHPPLDTKWTPPKNAGEAGTWQRDYGWPTGADLKDGHYDLTASVKDEDGRWNSAYVSFDIKKK